MKGLLSNLLYILPLVASQSNPLDWQIGDLIDISSNFTDGAAELVVTYPVGDGPSNTIVTVFERDCDTEITDGGITADSFLDKDVDEASIEITFDKASIIDGKPYVNFTSSDFSAGIISFCTKLELIAADGTSVSYKKTEFVVSFDLSEISFLVGAEIDEDDVDVVDVDDVDISAFVDGCVCSSSSYDCDPNPPVFTQNDVAPQIFICVFTSSADYKISNLQLDLENPENAFVYSPVSLGSTGPSPDFLTDITTSLDGTIRVETLLVTGLFDDEASTVEINGAANLVFATGKTEDLNTAGFSLSVNVNTGKEQDTVTPLSSEENEETSETSENFLSSIINIFFSMITGVLKFMSSFLPFPF